MKVERYKTTFSFTFAIFQYFNLRKYRILFSQYVATNKINDTDQNKVCNIVHTVQKVKF